MPSPLLVCIYVQRPAAQQVNVRFIPPSFRFSVHNSGGGVLRLFFRGMWRWNIHPQPQQPAKRLRGGKKVGKGWFSGCIPGRLETQPPKTFLVFHFPGKSFFFRKISFVCKMLHCCLYNST